VAIQLEAKVLKESSNTLSKPSIDGWEGVMNQVMGYMSFEHGLGKHK